MRGYEMKLNVAQSFKIFQQTTNLILKFDEINQMLEWNRKSSSNNFNSCYAKIESTARLIDERSSFKFESCSGVGEILLLPHIKLSRMLCCLLWNDSIETFAIALKIQNCIHTKESQTLGDFLLKFWFFFFVLFPKVFTSFSSKSTGFFSSSSASSLSCQADAYLHEKTQNVPFTYSSFNFHSLHRGIRSSSFSFSLISLDKKKS